MKGTLDFGIFYNISKDPSLCGYTDSDWEGYLHNRKFTSGYVVSLGIGAVTWTSKKQHAQARHPFFNKIKISSRERSMLGSLAQADALKCNKHSQDPCDVRTKA